MRKTLTTILIITTLIITSSQSEAQLSHEDAKTVWQKIEKATELHLPFEVKEEKTPNAWVRNGNSVTVTTGLLKILDTKSELYCVLAHEAGHAKLDHHEQTATRATGLSLLSFILGRMVDSDIGEVAANVGAQLAYSGWSREQEIEADDYAVTLAHNQKENPVGMYTALQKLSKINKTEPSGFNSHPPDERRLLHVRNKIIELNPKAKIPNQTQTINQNQTNQTNQTK
ncbi:MAG: M48 family metallopeptidase [Synergistaceae bacterium]